VARTRNAYRIIVEKYFCKRPLEEEEEGSEIITRCGFIVCVSFVQNLSFPKALNACTNASKYTQPPWG